MSRKQGRSNFPSLFVVWCIYKGHVGDGHIKVRISQPVCQWLRRGRVAKSG